MSDELVLANLIHNPEFTRKVLPHMRREYFTAPHFQAVFEVVAEYSTKYHSQATVEAVLVELQQKEGLSESTFQEATKFVAASRIDPNTKIDWLVEQAQSFAQDRALFNAMRSAVNIMNGTDREKLSKTAIPSILSQALAVTFDTSIGHDYLEDADKRFQDYHAKTQKIPFDILFFNQATDGGADRKTLSVILGGTNVGKTLIMCHMAASSFLMGFDVLYVTLEMSEERISRRIDSNLLNVTTDALLNMHHDAYKAKLDAIKSNSPGRLIVKEFPTSAVTTDAIRHLIEELKIKKNFVPDVIVVDYVNIINSARYKSASGASSYDRVKAAAEELRGIAVEYNAHVITGTQLNRTGFTSSDPDLDDTAESFGLPATADWMLVAVSTEELEKMGQYLFKQLKSRYKSKAKLRRFIVGVDVDRQKLYDVDDQTNVMDGPSKPPAKRSDKFSKVRTS